MTKFCIASAAFVLAGCGGSIGGEDAAPSFSSGADIHAALNKAGVTCPGYKPVVKEDRKLGMQSAADVGRCDLENENIIMAIWKDKGQKQNWIGMGEKIGCEMGKAFGVSSFDFVDGGLWTVGSTELFVAATRALESRHVDALVGLRLQTSGAGQRQSPGYGQ